MDREPYIPKCSWCEKPYTDCECEWYKRELEQLKNNDAKVLRKKYLFEGVQHGESKESLY